MSDIDAYVDIEEGEIFDDNFEQKKENTTEDDLLSKDQPEPSSVIQNQVIIRENHQRSENVRKRQIIDKPVDTGYKSKISKYDNDVSSVSGINEDDLDGKIIDREEKKLKKRICTYYQKTECKWGDTCNFLHAEANKTYEVCKFYLTKNCIKKDKCTYMHSDFPCKYFHAGINCNENTCAFSHKPLTKFTEDILLKHIKSAPKQILGDFPRKNNEDDEKIPSLFEINAEPPPELLSLAEAGVKGLEELDKKLAIYDKTKNIHCSNYEFKNIKKPYEESTLHEDDKTDVTNAEDDDILVIDLDPQDEKELSPGIEESEPKISKMFEHSEGEIDDDDYLINVLKNHRENTIKKETVTLPNIDLSQIVITSDLRNLINKIGNKMGNSDELSKERNPSISKDTDLRQILNQKKPVDVDLRTEYSYNLPFKPRISPAICEEINGSIFLYPTIKYELKKIEELDKPDYSYIKIDEYNMNGSLSRDPRLRRYIEKFKQSLFERHDDPHSICLPFQRKITHLANYNFFASFTKPLGVRDSPSPTQTSDQNFTGFDKSSERKVGLLGDAPSAVTANCGKRKVTRKAFLEWGQ